MDQAWWRLELAALPELEESLIWKLEVLGIPRVAVQHRPEAPEQRQLIAWLPAMDWPADQRHQLEQALAKFDAVHRLTEQIAPDKIGLALTAADVRRIAASGRKVALIGIENAYPIGEDLRRVKEFYDRGGRYMSLAHNGANQMSDSNTGERDGYMWKDGISPMGERVIAEMNRLGMMVDVSHPSRGSMLKAAQLSKAPIIASHSAVRALCDVPRNMDDQMLKALAATGGGCLLQPAKPKTRIESSTREESILDFP